MAVCGFYGFLYVAVTLTSNVEGTVAVVSELRKLDRICVSPVHRSKAYPVGGEGAETKTCVPGAYSRTELTVNLRGEGVGVGVGVGVGAPLVVTVLLTVPSEYVTVTT